MTILLHGFWGSPQDWNQVLAQMPLGKPVWAPDLYAAGELDSRHNIEAWTKHFIQKLESMASEPVTLVGYSMGGRLAAHALWRAPDRFRRALLISSAPFLFEQTAAEREAWESDWARRFRQESWATLEHDWSEQPIVKSSVPAPRRRAEALREHLALSLTNWSPRRHGFETKALGTLPSHVEWAFGALDQKYLRVAKVLQDLPVKGQIHEVPNAAHRVLSEQPKWIADWLAK